MEESVPISFFDAMLKDASEKEGEPLIHGVMAGLAEKFEMCAFCKKNPKAKEQFSKCGRCKETAYCSPKCQKVHWSEHKKICQDRSVKYPTFLDNDVSV